MFVNKTHYFRDFVSELFLVLFSCLKTTVSWCETDCNSWSFRFFPNAPATLLHSRTTLPALCALSSKFHGVVPLTGVYRSVGVFVRIWGGFRVRKRSPKHSKTSSPVQIRFFREGRRPEVCWERGVCHPHKVSGEFRGVVPRPLIPTQTTSFGAKTR